MNVPQTAIGLGLVASLLANLAIGLYAYGDHQRVNRLVYDYAHNVGDINDTRLGGVWMIDSDPTGGSYIPVEPCPETIEPGAPDWMRCYKHHFEHFDLASVVERLDGRVHQLEQTSLTEDAANFYGDDATRWAVKDAIRDWNAEHDQDGDFYWNFGEYPDACPDEAGTSSGEEDGYGCPTEDDIKAANDAAVKAEVKVDDDRLDWDALDKQVDATKAAGVEYTIDGGEQFLTNGSKTTVQCVVKNGADSKIADAVCTPVG